MSDIKFSCPQCQQHIQCDEAAYGGREIACPACGARMLVPGRAAPSAAASNNCPQCHAALGAGTVICAQCGYNMATGQRPGAPSASRPGARVPVRGPAPVAAATSWLKNPLVWAGVVVGIFGLLYIFARMNPIGLLAYALLALLFYVGVRILIIVSAFKEDAGTGFLTLCFEPYALYFVYAKSENPLLKALYAIALVALLAIRTLKGPLGD